MVNLEMAKLIIDNLNSMADADPLVFASLLCVRMPCNDTLANHPTCQVGKSNGGYVVGMLGILNGLCGVYDDGPKKGWGAIAAVFDPADQKGGEAWATLKKFQLVENVGCTLCDGTGVIDKPLPDSQVEFDATCECQKKESASVPIATYRQAQARIYELERQLMAVTNQ